MSHKRHIFLGASLGLVLRVSGAFLAVAAQVVIARVIGRDAFGVYSYAISWITILAVVGSLGFGSSVSRLLPVMLIRRQFETYKGALLTVIGLPLILSLCIAAIFLLSIYGLGFWSGTPYQYPIALVMLALPALSLSRVTRSLVLVLKRVFWSDFPQMICRPILLIALIWGASLFGIQIGAAQAALLYSIAVTASFLIGCVALWQFQPINIRGQPAAFEYRHIFVISAPMFLIEALSTVIGEFAVILLGAYREPSEIGIYAVAARLTLLIGFALQAANAVLNPMISEFYHENKFQELQENLTFAARMLSLLAIAVIAGLVVGGRFALGLFGPGFTEGYLILLILMAGQGVNALSGSVASVMKMSGHQNQACVVMVVAIAVNIWLCLWLIPRHGALGAAVAVAVSQVVWNLIMVAYCLYIIGLNPTVFPLPTRTIPPQMRPTSRQ